jgi:hypothetical protein
MLPLRLLVLSCLWHRQTEQKKKKKVSMKKRVKEKWAHPLFLSSPFIPKREKEGGKRGRKREMHKQGLQARQ